MPNGSDVCDSPWPPAATRRSNTPQLTYVSDQDHPLTRAVIRGVEVLTGARQLQRMYEELQSELTQHDDLWAAAVEKLRLEIAYSTERLSAVPSRGPVVFVANHPFGVVDGLVLCYLISRVRQDFFLLVNESVLPQPLVDQYLLPIDFHPTKAAVQTNLQTKRQTTLRLKAGQSLAIFPSGMVATANRFLGRAREMPWHTFVCRRIHESQATVVPLYFHGQNGPLFHVASQVSMAARLGLLIHETRTKIGKQIRVEIGEPIPYESLQAYRAAQDLIQHLRGETLALAAGDQPRRRVFPLSKLSRRNRRAANCGDLFVSP